MRKIYAIAMAAGVLFFAGCTREDSVSSGDNNVGVIQTEPLTAKKINSLIDHAIQTKGSFDWKDMSAHELWSASIHGDNIFSIGFGNSSNDFDRSKSTKHRVIQQEILELISQYEDKPLNEILISADQVLTTMDVVITRQETVIALRRSDYIRYLEPGNYKYFSVADSMRRESESSSSSSSGCGFDALLLDPADYTTIMPNAKAGWSLYQHNIPAAWNISTGSGVTIGIVDTGVSPQQSLLGTSFNDGMSSGRTLQKYGTYVDSIWPWSTTTDGPNDQCGHGTSMASAAAAPRNDDGLPVGVAYNANLITYRAASNVVLDGMHEQNGVKNALTALGNNSAVKIISMSMGHIFSVGKISDGIKYAYGKGKLIFCAGGTSTSFTNFVGVIFPASMAETVAVTGVKEGSTYQLCSDCHSGSKIEFTVVMERATSGNHSPVLSYYNNQTDYVGGSSVATATTAGIAALVWSKYPTWTRSQVLARMRQSGTFYPVKHSSYGYGNINALTAVQ
ncbi:MAG TPA: S8 family serine peptidase [Flavobacterium sp.]